MTPAQFREARQSLGLTQTELALMMGYTRQASISAMEKNGPTPQASLLIRALLLFGPPDGWVTTKNAASD